MVNLDKPSFEKFLLGDDKIFGMIFSGVSPLLYAHAYKYVRRRDVAEDIVAEAFLVLLENRAKMRAPQHINNFLFRIVRNMAVDCLRERGRVPVLHGLRAEDLTQLEDLSDDATTSRQLQLAELAWIFIHRQIEEQVGQLPEKCQQIFHLRWTEGRSVDEITVLLDIRPSTVYNQLQYAYKKIRKVFNDNPVDKGG